MMLQHRVMLQHHKHHTWMSAPAAATVEEGLPSMHIVMNNIGKVDQITGSWNPAMANTTTVPAATAAGHAGLA